MSFTVLTTKANASSCSAAGSRRYFVCFVLVFGSTVTGDQELLTHGPSSTFPQTGRCVREVLLLASFSGWSGNTCPPRVQAAAP